MYVCAESLRKRLVRRVEAGKINSLNLCAILFMGIAEDLRELQEQRFKNSPVRPEDVFKAAMEGGIIDHCVTSWRAGHCTWEQAMMGAVIYLHNENIRLRKQVFELAKLQPPPMLIRDIERMGEKK